jgi:tripartite-type tricarboxylate transporter receptor subunit TctC
VWQLVGYNRRSIREDLITLQELSSLAVMSKIIAFPRAALALALSCAFVAAGAHAADYPARPIRIIVPYAAGGSTDTVARVIAPRLTQRLGQQVVVDNRTGAGTLIGTEIAVRSTPDGYTLLMATPPLAVNPALYSKVPYVLERDFSAIGNVAASTNLLAVHPSVAANTTSELIALLKKNPGKLNYGSSGVGGASHLAMALFESMAGVDVAHVPYKGGAPAVLDLVAGRISLMMANLTTAQPHIRAGRLRGIAVGKLTRSPLFPEMPTLAESGVPGYEANNWNGLVVRRGTPQEVVARLNREIVSILSDADVARTLTSGGLEPVPDTPQQFDAYLRSEASKWQGLVKKIGLTAQGA